MPSQIDEHQAPLRDAIATITVKAGTKRCFFQIERLAAI